MRQVMCAVLIDATGRRTIKQAMRSIEKATEVNGQKCIQFIPKTEEEDYVNVELIKTWVHRTNDQLENLIRSLLMVIIITIEE